MSHTSIFVRNALNDANNMTPYYMRHSQIFDKKSFKCPWQQKTYITSLKKCLIYIYLLVGFFSLPLWIPGENRAKLKKLLNLKSRLSWVAQDLSHADYTYYFLISTCRVQVIFWTENNFCFISDCRNPFSCKLKKLINEQIIIFYNPSNALCSSDKFVPMKNFKYHPIHCYIPFSLASISKYCIFVNEDTSSLKQIEQMYKSSVIRQKGASQTGFSRKQSTPNFSFGEYYLEIV